MTQPVVTVEVALVPNPYGTLVWTDVSAYAILDDKIASARGRNYELGQTQAGTASLTLQNTDGRFDPTNVGVNLLDASTASFEDGGVGGWSPGTSWTIANTTAQSLDGTRSLRATRINTTPAFGYIVHTATVTAAQQYTFSVWVRASAATPFALRYQDGDGVHSTAISFTPTANTWTKATLVFTATTTSSGAQLFFDDGVNGAPTNGSIVDVDAVRLVAGTESPYAPYVLPMRPIRIRSTYLGVTYNLWRGFVERWPQQWSDPSFGVVPLTGVDGFKAALAKKYGTRYPDQVVADTPLIYVRLNGSGTNLGTSGIGAPTGDFVNGGAPGLIAGTTDTAAYRTAAIGTSGVQLTPGSTSSVWSVEFWVNATTTSATATTLLSLGNVTMPYSGGVYTVTIAGTATTATFTAAATHHIVITNDVTVTPSTWSVYIDGVLEFTGTIAGAPGNTLPNTAIQVMSGTVAAMSGGSTVTVDEAAVYGYVLNASQVAHHYNLGNAGSNTYAEFTQETVDQRIGHVLDTVGWPAADRVIDASLTVLQATGSVAGSTALDLILAAAAANGGNVFIDGSGRFVYLDRQHYYAGGFTSAATFSETGFPYESGVTVDFDDTYLFNDVQVTQANSSPAYTAMAADVDSQTQYGVQTYTATISAAATADVDGLAAYLLSNYRAPHARIAQVTLEGRANLTNMPQILGREIGDVVTVVRDPPGAAPAITLRCIVQGITRSIDPRSLAATFLLSPLPDVWIVGDTTYGVLDVTAVTAY